jgi:hypothetical protein
MVEIGLSNAQSAFMNRVGGNPAAAVSRDGKTYLKSKIPADADPVDLDYMRRTAMASLETVYPPSEIRQIQIGIESYRYPRFTSRNAPAPPPSVSMATTPWADAQFVTPYCCASREDVGRGLR